MERFLKLAVVLLTGAVLSGVLGGCNVIDFPQGDYPNGELLVSGDFLETILSNEGVVIIDARSSGYETGHITGAVNLKWTDYVDADTKLLPPEDIAEKLGAAGLSRGMTFIIYDDSLTSWGAAGRIFWMLEYLGCTDVHILNGGWNLWKTENRDVETTATTLPAGTFMASAKSSVLATKESVSSMIDDSGSVIIDSRTDEEYNGWQFYGEARGGHIPGAVQIPYAWFFADNSTVLGADAIKSLLESRGVTPDKEVTAYCTAGIRSGFIYFALRLMGYQRCSNYANSMLEWSADESLPMDKMQNYEKLVSPAWVKDLIDGKKPATYAGKGYVILECSWGPAHAAEGDQPTDYDTGHIPGAIHFDTDNFEDGYPTWYLREDAELQKMIENFGITTDTTVVVYSTWQIAAARIQWILMYAGVKDVRFLNGGYAAWVSSGGTQETDENLASPAADFGATVPVHPEYLAETAHVREKVEKSDEQSVIVDVRSWDEYTGLISGYDYIEAKGRIPGAVWARNCDDSTRDYLDADKTLRSYEEVQSLWDNAGATADKELIFYCGGGWRSSLAFYHAFLMGYQNVRNYSSGWSEWSTVYGPPPDYTQSPSDNPIATGEP